MLVRNAFKLLTGVLGAQLLSFLLLPVLTRLYSSSDFGELGVFISLSGLFALLMSLRLEQLILIDGFSQRKMTFSLSVSVIPLTSLFLISFILLSGSLSLPLYFSVELLFYSIVAGAFICLINSSYQFRLIENNINSASFITFSRIVSVLVFQFVF
jgi:O-antigen/teichoic acid export membrane protein